jgi:hypothetical protein
MELRVAALLRGAVNSVLVHTALLSTTAATEAVAIGSTMTSYTES